jgi:hypothetical protein
MERLFYLTRSNCWNSLGRPDKRRQAVARHTKKLIQHMVDRYGVGLLRSEPPNNLSTDFFLEDPLQERALTTLAS